MQGRTEYHFIICKNCGLSNRNNTESREFCQLKPDHSSQSVYKKIKAGIKDQIDAALEVDKR